MLLEYPSRTMMLVVQCWSWCGTSFFTGVRGDREGLVNWVWGAALALWGALLKYADWLGKRSLLESTIGMATYFFSTQYCVLRRLHSTLICSTTCLVFVYIADRSLLINIGWNQAPPSRPRTARAHSLYDRPIRPREMSFSS